jgi:hypothetical protein
VLEHVTEADGWVSGVELVVRELVVRHSGMGGSSDAGWRRLAGLP